MNKFTVSLDIDETLIHSSEVNYSDEQVRFGGYWTIPRPHLGNFLKDLSGFSDIGFYTHASEDYAKLFIKEFCPWLAPKFLLSRKNCIQQWSSGGYYGSSGPDHFKDLKKAVRHRLELNRLIAVDDRPYLYPRQYGNVVGVPEFSGDSGDLLLPKLLKYLRFLSAQENVRTLEKRGWISKF
jgi:TFIIF-interacting CTD phosphatase-like protein